MRWLVFKVRVPKSKGTRERLANRVALFYSNRRPEDSAFLQELQQIGSENKNYQMIGIMTEMEKSKQAWNGETRFIDKAMLARYVSDFRPDGKTSAVLIPPAFGLAGVNLHTWTGWGSVTYWNAFVANLEMHGKGTV
jgi:Na+-transporting NADH:ubiquinone oxidoreductase subunit NqrF